MEHTSHDHNPRGEDPLSLHVVSYVRRPVAHDARGTADLPDVHVGGPTAIGVAVTIVIVEVMLGLGFLATWLWLTR